jgi:cyclic pyranopterin phosphate synthase
MEKFTHLDADGNALMVDVGDKQITAREAVAVGSIHMNKECYLAVKAGSVKKGNVLSVAQVAGIMGAKKTSQLIPLCHILPLTHCSVEFALDAAKQEITASCRVKCDGKTGVEMEALTGVTITLLTIYDMCKALDKNMLMSNIHLVEKTGGKSGHFLYTPEAQNV